MTIFWFAYFDEMKCGHCDKFNPAVETIFYMFGCFFWGVFQMNDYVIFCKRFCNCFLIGKYIFQKNKRTKIKKKIK